MAVKMEDLRIGMEIAFSSLDGMDTQGWLVDTDEPYKVIEISENRVYVELLGKHVGNFYVECDELRDVYIFDSLQANYMKGEWQVINDSSIKLLDNTIGILEILTKYYDSIPSELIKELIDMNKTELVIK